MLKRDGADPSSARGNAVGVAEAGAGRELRNVIVVQFAIAGGGLLFVGCGDGRAGGVSQREFDDTLQRDGLGEQRRWGVERRPGSIWRCAAPRHEVFIASLSVTRVIWE